MSSKPFSDYVKRPAANGFYYYYRKVPTEVAEMDGRVHIKQSLKTKDLATALAKAAKLHKATEDFWKALARGSNSESALEQYNAAVAAARSLGFTYKSTEDIANLDLAEIETRIAAIENNGLRSTTVINAALGTAPEPNPQISDIPALYEKYNSEELAAKSENQRNRHMDGRRRAINYLIAVVGDLDLSRISRADTLAFKEWWKDKIREDGLTAYSANRSFSDIAGMLSVIDNALLTNFHGVWEKLRIKETAATKLARRPPFPIEWVRDVILKPGALDGLNEQARAIVEIFCETGARPTEICNLRPEDIHILAEVPHIEVAERDDRVQKTKYSVRRIPLVGVALKAAKQHPQGFPKYRDKEATLSAIVNKYMKHHGMRPTDDHTFYSLRHTFQDRIENAGASERMQADLMGHEFGRPIYGDGSEMKRRLAFLESIAFKPEQPS